MHVVDSRRLTGPNLLMDRAGAVLDVALDGEDPAEVMAAWRSAARRVLAAVGWARETLHTRGYPGGLSLAFTAPVDALYAATEVNEWAWDAAAAALAGAPEPSLEAGAEALRERITEERSPRLLALKAAAETRGVTFLSDDETASVGLGTGCQSWPVDALPDPEAVDWDRVHDIPVVLVTGTNGKTTTVRLLAALIAAAGRVPGTTSTDGIAVAGEMVEPGDYAGPGGARRVLRDPRVEMAVLETARGGILRRGLAVPRADAAIVTNIAEDHLGETGVHDLESLAAAKLVVARALGLAGRLVLNGDDPLLVAGARTVQAPVTWVTVHPEVRAVRAHVEAGGHACAREAAGELVLARAGSRTAVVHEAEVPITVGGAARYNVYNVLGAIGLADALGLPLDAVRAGLREFGVHAADNPGRGALYRLGGVTVLVDFAHNPHGMAALVEMARTLPAERRLVVLGQAGDRDDASIRELVRIAARLRPDRVLVKEMREFLRGREEGEIPALILEELDRIGHSRTAVERVDTETDAVRRALAWARPGDLLVIPVHAARDEVLMVLDGLADRGGQPDGAPT